MKLRTLLTPGYLYTIGITTTALTVFTYEVLKKPTRSPIPYHSDSRHEKEPPQPSAQQTIFNHHI